MAMIDICNEALAEIGADSIASINEASVSAKECARWYNTTLADLLELHDWGFAIRRLSLTLVPNDRAGEWAYAYAKPPTVASLIRILPGISDGDNGGYPACGLLRGGRWDDLPAIPYVEDAGTIYANIRFAVLEYSSSAIDDALIPALFRRAFVYELASRLAMPIRKDRQVKGDLIKLALNARAIAMADDMNRYPRRDPVTLDDVSMARIGYGCGLDERTWVR